MKLIVHFVLTLCLTIQLHAQDARITPIDWNQTKTNGIQVNYSMPAEMVDGALRKKWSDAGLGSGDKGKDGFRIYKGSVVPEIAKEKMDYYVKVDAVQGQSVLSVLISKGYDNFLKPDIDSETYKQAKTYFNAFVKDATAFMVNHDITNQQNSLLQLEKDKKNLLKNEKNLNKKKEKLESELAETKIEMAALKSDMENQQKALELVRTKTATIDQVDALKKEVSKQESVTKKASKKYEQSLEDVADAQKDVAENAHEIEENKMAMERLEQQMKGVQDKIKDLQNQLSYLK
ncbi:MAG TPA: hypothetical protein PLP34_03990 [Chitinophagaceae bacterium]|nr:hypothetical protein [Chitinophagaceae bacterium]HNF71548.1 hypothetical protein [Chitinophagaceae bacterium]